MITLIVIGCILWYIIGMASFIYWWTSEHDFDTSLIPLCLFFGFFGLITFIIGADIHKEPIVIFKKRG